MEPGPYIAPPAGNCIAKFGVLFRSFLIVYEHNFFILTVKKCPLKAPSLKRHLLTRCRLTEDYENNRRLSDACGHINKKKCIFVIFGKFKKRNPRAVGFFRRILDRNVVVMYSVIDLDFLSRI